MITMFTSLKPNLEDPYLRMIQTNAIRSWQQMVPEAEIIVLSDKPGAQDFCAEIGVDRFSGVMADATGLEYVHSIFSQAWKRASFDLCCYCNSDMILPPNFSDVARSIDAASFLMVGHRWNLPEQYIREINFTPGWWRSISLLTRDYGARHAPSGIDYFVHKKGFLKLPPLLVGRWYWDNAVLALAKEKGIPLIDASDIVFAIHQNHPQGYTGTDLQSQANRELVPDQKIVTIENADYKLIQAGA